MLTWIINFDDLVIGVAHLLSFLLLIAFGRAFDRFLNK